MTFQCIGCESSFREKKSVKQHMRECHGFKNNKCNHCNFRSEYQCNVLRHIKSFHKKHQL